MNTTTNVNILREIREIANRIETIDEVVLDSPDKEKLKSYIRMLMEQGMTLEQIEKEILKLSSKEEIAVG